MLTTYTAIGWLIKQQNVPNVELNLGLWEIYDSIKIRHKHVTVTKMTDYSFYSDRLQTLIFEISFKLEQSRKKLSDDFLKVSTQISYHT